MAFTIANAAGLFATAPPVAGGNIVFAAPVAGDLNQHVGFALHISNRHNVLIRPNPSGLLSGVYQGSVQSKILALALSPC